MKSFIIGLQSSLDIYKLSFTDYAECIVGGKKHADLHDQLVSLSKETGILVSTPHQMCSSDRYSFYKQKLQYTIAIDSMKQYTSLY
jgi:hypothetical protein